MPLPMRHLIIIIAVYRRNIDQLSVLQDVVLCKEFVGFNSCIQRGFFKFETFPSFVTGVLDTEGGVELLLF